MFVKWKVDHWKNSKLTVKLQLKTAPLKLRVDQILLLQWESAITVQKFL